MATELVTMQGEKNAGWKTERGVVFRKKKFLSPVNSETK